MGRVRKKPDVTIPIGQSTDDEPLEQDPNIEIPPQPNIIYRSGWNAMAPKSKELLSLPVPVLIQVQTSTDECKDLPTCIKAVQDLQSAHMLEGLPDIKYNFLIGGDGNIYEGRGWDVHPYKDPEYIQFEGRCIQVAYIGDFKDKVPDKTLLKTGVSLLAVGYYRELIPRVFELVPLYYKTATKIDFHGQLESEPLKP